MASSSQAESSESVGLLDRVPDTITVFDNPDLRTFNKDVELYIQAKGNLANIQICVPDLLDFYQSGKVSVCWSGGCVPRVQEQGLPARVS